MSARTFHRTVITYEILSEDLPGDFDLEALHHAVTDGGWSGMWLDRQEETVDGPTMVRLLTEQGSDPEFLGLDEAGNDLEDP